jgi:hypothetical protein
MGLFVIKCVNAPYAAIVVIFGVAGYAAAFPKGYTVKGSIGIVPNYKHGKYQINACGFNNLHS